MITIFRKSLLVGIVLSFTSMAHGISLTSTTDASVLVNNIIGSGITVSAGTETFTGTTDMAATFSGGTDPVGFNSGIVLMTGNVNDIPGPNPTNSAPETEGSGFSGGPPDPSQDRAQSGDSDLDTIVGNTTFDAAVLEFDFQFGDGSAGGDLFFNFVFASEEYVDFVGSQYNDVFALFVDGENIALIPGTNTPIAINNVNGSSNSSYYRNNVANNNGFGNLLLDTAFDGLTTVLTATKSGLGSGLHTMKFAVADTSDGILDAAVFIQAGSFSNTDPNQIPEPTTFALMGLGLAGIGYKQRKQKKAA